MSNRITELVKYRLDDLLSHWLSKDDINWGYIKTRMLSKNIQHFLEDFKEVLNHEVIKSVDSFFALKIYYSDGSQVLLKYRYPFGEEQKTLDYFTTHSFPDKVLIDIIADDNLAEYSNMHSYGYNFKLGDILYNVGNSEKQYFVVIRDGFVDFMYLVKIY